MIPILTTWAGGMRVVRTRVALGWIDAYAALAVALAVVSQAAAYFLGRKAMRSSSQSAQVTNVTRPA